MNTQPVTTDDGAAVISFDAMVVDLKVHRLLQLDEKIKEAQEARAELANEIIEHLDAATPDGSAVISGIKVTVVRPVRRLIDLAQLELVASRRLFAKLTKRVVDIKAFDAHLQAGTAGIDAVAKIVTEVESAPSLRITK